MSWNHFGAAVAVAGLLTGLPIAPGEVGEGGYGRTELSGYGSGLFRAVNGVLVVDSIGVADVSGGHARNTRSYLPENDPVSAYEANIPPTTRSNIISSPNAVDRLFLQSIYDKGNSNNSGTFANASGRPSVSTQTLSSRAPTSRPRPTSTLRAEGCARCGGEVARASASRPKLLVALFSRTFFPKGGSVRPRHQVAGIGRQRDAPLLTASTIQHGWRIPSL